MDEKIEKCKRIGKIYGEFSFPLSLLKKNHHCTNEPILRKALCDSYLESIIDVHCKKRFEKENIICNVHQIASLVSLD